MWSNKKTGQQHRHKRYYTVVSMLVALLTVTLGQVAVFDGLEGAYYEWLLARFAGEVHSEKLVLLHSDEQDSHLQLARALNKLHSAGSVVLLRPLDKAEHAHSLQRLRKDLSLSHETISAVSRSLDTSPKLARAIKQAANVWLVSYAESADPTPSPSYHYLHNQKPAPVSAMHNPLPELQQAASGVGVLITGERPSAFSASVQLDGQDYPNLLVQLLRSGQDSENKYTVYYPKTDVDRAGGLARHDLQELLSGELAGNALSGKIVLLGDTRRIAPYAVALGALLQNQQVQLPAWLPWAQYGSIVLVMLFLMLVLPRLGLAAGLLASVLLLFILLNTEAMLLLLFSQWLPLMMPVLLLIAGYFLLTPLRHNQLHEQGLLQELSAANLELGRMLQSQGELEQAWQKYRRCLPGAALFEQLYNLGLDFERKRQFNKAATLFAELKQSAKKFRDVDERLQRNREMGEHISLSPGNVAPGGTLVMEATAGLQRPTLGHYHIEKEIGRGAMGMVYLAQDPRMNREVAIKTMALSQEFEGRQLEDIKERFYREAETAGRLSHPNIVTVYDIGEEQELAYIAMDYLQGEDLSAFCEEDNLLPFTEVMGIMEQVAEALEYAHHQRVVHRDIKPANIVYDAERNVVKVTDFGVACLTDTSKTKTGTVLGSPSYMSPEQVAGKRVDGRADIFSLGVTLYQLSTGHLPFEADSLSNLIYKITNEHHTKPSKHRKDIPVCLTRIINKCMQKEAERRYQSAADVAAALGRCRGL